MLDTIINDLSSLARDRPPVLVAQILVGIEITLELPDLALPEDEEAAGEAGEPDEDSAAAEL